MADTVRTLIRDALTTIGASSPAETSINPNNAQYCLRLLRNMTDAWKAERLFIYLVNRTTYPIVAGKGQPGNPYTIGPGGDFNQQRPIWIQNAGIITNPGSQNEFELPLTIYTDDQWAQVGLKRSPTTLPVSMYYDYAFTSERGNIFFWPVPTITSIRLALYCPLAVEALDDLDAEVIYPPGYQDALHFNLAVRLCPGFSRPVDPDVRRMADDAKAVVMRSNVRTLELGVDPALLAYNTGTWNWISGQSAPSR